MAAAFDSDTRELIRLWADKAPECGATDKPRVFKDVNGMDVPLSRNTVYNGSWKFRYAFVQETGFPVVQGGPIPHNQDTQQPKGKLNMPKVSMQTVNGILKEVYGKAPKPSLTWDLNFELGVDETGHDPF